MYKFIKYMYAKKHLYNIIILFYKCSTYNTYYALYMHRHIYTNFLIFDMN
jgi:hypothetical protein